MHKTEFVTYHPRYLGEIVEFWNEEFADRRNFFRMTRDDFEQRVVRGVSDTERFVADGLILAREHSRVVGMIHVLKRSRETCLKLFPNRKSGSQGVIAFFAVARDRRGHGLGADLLRRGEALLKDRSEIIIDGQCLTPFYGNARGPFTPVWGTPEGPAVSEDDIVTVEFLENRGYNPRWRGVSLMAPLDLIDGPTVAQGHLPEDCMLQTFSSRIQVPGREPGEFFATSFVTGGQAVGTLVFFEMREVARGAGAIYHFEVDEKFKGRGIGTEVLKAALKDMKRRDWHTCEVLTIPDLSPEAGKLYAQFDFDLAALWLIY